MRRDRAPRGRKGARVMMRGLFLIGSAGFLVVASILGTKLIEATHIDMSALGERILGLGEGIIEAGADVVAVVCLFVSCRISMRILAKKEFWGNADESVSPV